MLKVLEKRTPQTVLPLLMKYYDLDPITFASRLGVPMSTIIHLLAGRTALTAELALRLEKFFAQPAAYWLSLQSDAELEIIRPDTLLANAIEQIQCIIPQEELDKFNPNDGLSEDERHIKSLQKLGITIPPEYLPQ